MTESLFEDEIENDDRLIDVTRIPVTPVTLRTVFGFGLAFAFVACLILIQPYCFQTYTQFLTTEAMAHDLPSGIPQPIALGWTPTTFSIINALARFTPAAVLGLHIFLFGILLYFLLRILNPTFRMTTGVDWDSTVLHKTYMHTTPLIKAFLIGVTAFLPAFFVWRIIMGIFGDNPTSLLFRLILSGSAMWLLFSREGLAGDYEMGNYLLPHRRQTAMAIAIRGGVAGFALWLMVRFAPYADSDDWFAYYKTLGGFGESAWWNILATISGLWAWVVFGLGGLFVSLGHPNISIEKRVRLGLLPTIILLSGLYFSHVWVPRHLKSDHDFLPTSKVSSPERLAKKIGVKMAPSGSDVVLLLRDKRAIPIVINHQSFTGMDASPETGKKVEAYLQQRGYRTSLQEAAFYVLHDVASLSWDSTASLKVDYDNLTHISDPQYLNVFLDKLRTCAATPEAHKYLDLLADESHFRYNERQSFELIGDLYARIGDRKNASDWYKKALISTTQIPARISDHLMFNTGIITGKLLLDGKPVVGARVGIMPIELARSAPYNFLPNGTVRPYWLRWMSASTRSGPDGSFKFDHIVAETYRLIVSIPGKKVEDFALTSDFEHWSGQGIFVGFGEPKNNVGKVMIYSSSPKGVSQIKPDEEPAVPDGRPQQR